MFQLSTRTCAKFQHFRDCNFALLMTSVCSAFYAVYIVKQTILAVAFGLAIELSLAFLFALILAANSKDFLIYVCKWWRYLIPFFLSTLLVAILFNELSSTAYMVCKLVLVLCLAIITKRIGGYLLLSLADIGVATVVMFAVLANIGWVPNNPSVFNGNWVKNYIGFINPNIGPFFIFSSLFVYFLMEDKKRFWSCALLIFFSWKYLNVFSRTFIVGTMLLLIYNFLQFFPKKCHLWFRPINYLTLGSTICYLLISLLVILGFINIYDNFLAYLDKLLSARLTKMAEIPFLVSESGPIMKIYPIDSIYYELLFLLGPFAFFMWLKYYYDLVYDRNQKKISQIEIYALNIFLLIGLVEGLFAKFSSMLVTVIMIMFIGSKDQPIFYRKNLNVI